jgi:NADH-quinone oxidoreductase subunit J
MIAFWVLAPIMVIAALGILFVRKAVHAALLLAVVMMSLAVLYLVLEAPFLFAVQIIVYAGAIMVLFLFVIMLLGVDADDDLRERLVAQRPVAIALGLAVVAEIFFAVRAGIGLSTRVPDTFGQVNAGGNTQALAKVLFTKYFFPFEVTSVLLIVAAIATMVLAQRKARAITQAEIEAITAHEEAPDPEVVG